MTKRIEKLVIKMKRQPHDISFDEAKRVLFASGYELVRQKGSHTCFRSVFGDVVVIVATNPIKAVYVRDILSRIGE